MVKNPSPDPPFISHYAIIQGEMGLFLTFSIFELQRGYLYQNGVEFRQKVIGAGLNLVIFTTSQGYMDLSPAVGHVRECPHSGTRYLEKFSDKGIPQLGEYIAKMKYEENDMTSITNKTKMIIGDYWNEL